MIETQGGAVAKLLGDMPAKKSWRVRVALFFTICIVIRLLLVALVMYVANRDVGSPGRDGTGSILEVGILLFLVASSAIWAYKYTVAPKEVVWWSRASHSAFYGAAAILWGTGMAFAGSNETRTRILMQTTASYVLLLDVLYGIGTFLVKSGIWSTLDQ